MRRNRRRKQKREESIDFGNAMTPMIDMVFQLLIYFLVTFSAAEVVAHLDISRPAPDKKATQDIPPPDLIRVTVESDKVGLNGRLVSMKELSDKLERLAAVNTEQTVMVSCSDESNHGELVRVLDLCAKAGLKNLAVTGN